MENTSETFIYFEDKIDFGIDSLIFETNKADLDEYNKRNAVEKFYN